jgi:hypothetical protein
LQKTEAAAARLVRAVDVAVSNARRVGGQP